MIEKELLEILACPDDHTALRMADDQLLAELNRAIAAGGVHNRADQPVEQPLEGGLVREDGTLLYPIVDDIPVLLIDEGIPLGQIQ